MVTRPFASTTAPRTPAYQENRARNLELLALLRQRTASVQAGGPADAVTRHRSRGKLTARAAFA